MLRAFPALSPHRRVLRWIGGTVVFQIIYVLVAVLGGSSRSFARHASASGDPSPDPRTAFDKKQEHVAYVGDQVCAECHQDKVAAYHRTAHAHTSSLPTGNSIAGKFDAGANTLHTSNPDLVFEMEANDKGYFQTAKVRVSESQILYRSERIDIVIGSGRKGQTYLFWDGDRLFELPVSYWTELGAWINSPSYPDGSASFERPVLPRCLECHASLFKSSGPLVNIFDKNSLSFGLSCEKCHGPGSEHVARFRAKTPPPSAQSAIVNPARLSRDRQIDVCALCHAGIGTSITPPLSYLPGDVLEQHLVFPKIEPGAPIDVHASQVQLLERSRCFQSSPSMTCSTCHDVHTPQRELEKYAVTCLSCHKIERCGLFASLGRKIENQCITCHMPLQQTEQIAASLNGRTLQPKVRNHQIAIYPQIALP